MENGERKFSKHKYLEFWLVLFCVGRRELVCGKGIPNPQGMKEKKMTKEAMREGGPGGKAGLGEEGTSRLPESKDILPAILLVGTLERTVQKR